MRGQQSSISQPIPRQQSGYDDTQLLQQHLMYTQLQEFQMQQQLQQLGQEQKQQNSLNHMSAMSKQTSVNQLPTLVNGMPVNDMPNYSWQNEFAGSDPKIPRNSQMSMVSNMNFPQLNMSPAMYGFSNDPMFSHEQEQTLRSMTFVPQQSDQSLYGMPVSNPQTLNYYSQHPGMSRSLESASYNSFQHTQNLYDNPSGPQHSALASKQDLYRKNIFGHMDSESVNSNIQRNFQQTEPIEKPPHDEELNVRQAQTVWPGNLQGNEAPQSGCSQVSGGLDPTEQKILFSSDDDWASVGTSDIMGMSGLHASHLEGSTFPSIQSGSWSALMQSAVAEASSGDMGLQDEWSGLTYQKAEPMNVNHNAVSNDNAKLQSGCFLDNIHRTSALPSSSPTFENKEKPASISYSNTEKAHFNTHSMEGSWGQQHNTPQYTFNSQTNDKRNVANIDGSHSSSVVTSFRAPGIDTSMQHGRMNDSMKDRDQSATKWNNVGNQLAVSSPSMVGLEQLKSANCLPQTPTAAVNSNSSKDILEINQQGFYHNEIDYAKHAVLDSSTNSQGNENIRNNNQIPIKNQVWESSISNSDKVSGEVYDRTQEYGSQREVSNDSYISTPSHPDHSSDSVGAHRALSGINSYSLGSVSQKPHSQVDNEIPQRFHYYPIGNSVSGTETKGSQKQAVYAHGPVQMAARGSKVPDNRYAQHSLKNSPLDVTSMHVNHSQRTSKCTAEINAKGNTNSQNHTVPASFDKSAVIFQQNNQSGLPSQNMLELLNKVDQSREGGNNVTCSVFSDGNTVYQRNIAMFSDGFAAHTPQNQTSTFQGAGLRLSLPSQQLSTNSKLASHLSSGTVHNHNPENCDLEVEVGDPKRTESNSLVPVQSLPPSHQDFSLYDRHRRSVASGQITKEKSESSTQMVSDSMATKSSDMVYANDKLQQHQFSGPNGNTAINHPGNLLSAAQYDPDSYTALSSRQQTADSLDCVPVISQPSLPGSSRRIPPFGLASSPDTHSHVISQSYHNNTQGQSQPITGDNSYRRNSDHHLHKPGSVQASQPSLVSGVLHNAWSNTSTQCLSNNQDKKDDESNPHNVGAYSSNPQNLSSHAFHNTWTNIPIQRLPINMSKESLISLQTINSCKHGTSSWNSQNICNQDQKGGQSKSHNVGAYSSNPQNLSYAKEILRSTSLKQQHVVQGKVDTALQTCDASQGKESLSKQTSDGKSVIANSSLGHNHHPARDKPGTAAPYSLLQQVQAMKAFEINPSNNSTKRLKQTEIRSDSQQLFGNPPQKFLGYNTSVKSSADELSAVVHHGSFTSDSRMLSFSSEGTEQQNLNKPQGVDQVINQDLGSSRPNVSQNYPHSVSINSNQLHSRGHAQHIRINPQMASTWFEHYGNLSNESIPAVFSDPQKNIKMSTEPYFAPKASEGMAHIVVEKGHDVGQNGCTLQIASSTSTGANEQLSSLEISSPGVLEFEVKIPKKRKNATSELQPWHTEINQEYGIRKLIRMAERDWVQSSNRLIEKVENESEIRDDRHPLLRARKRLKLTSLLMQHLVPAVPALFKEPASKACENIIYLVARQGLGNACGLVSGFKNDSCKVTDGVNMAPGKLKDCESSGDPLFLKYVENILGRASKLEMNLNRLGKTTSLLDVRVECEDIARISMINRLVKFHGRTQANGVTSSSSTSELNPNLFVQRYITCRRPMDSNVLELVEGVDCLSL